MSIAFRCSCSQTIRTDERHAGKKVRCPKCAAALVVPRPGAVTATIIPPQAIQTSPGSVKSYTTPFPKQDAPPLNPTAYSQNWPAEDELDLVEEEQLEVVGDSVPTAEIVETDEFEVLEGDRDLPTVKEVRFVKRRRAKEDTRPNIRDLHTELYEREDYVFPIDPTLLTVGFCLAFTVGFFLLGLLAGQFVIAVPGIVLIWAFGAVARFLLTFKK